MIKILVTGATGNLGKDVIDFLLAKTSAANIIALVRDAESEKAKEIKSKGIALRAGEYNDYESLVTAFKGIDKLYFISGNDIVARAQQHENVVKAATASGVSHVVYTSFERKNESADSPIALLAEGHIKTEKWLMESPMRYTILKHNVYMDMLPMFLGEQLLETGTAYLPAGEGRVAFTLRKDMAEVASIILTTEGHENKVYDITNDQTVSFAEIASAIALASGKPVVYVSPTNEEYMATLTRAGVPGHYVSLFAGFAEAFKQGEFDQTSNAIVNLTGRKPTAVSDFLQLVYSPIK